MRLFPRCRIRAGNEHVSKLDIPLKLARSAWGVEGQKDPSLVADRGGTASAGPRLPLNGNHKDPLYGCAFPHQAWVEGI